MSTKYFLQGTYEANVVGSNFDAMLSANDIISPVPSVDLLDGADYTFRLEYQDRGNNPIAGVEVSMLRFDTTRPSFTSATLNLSTGLLIIAASETLNLDTNDRSAYYAVNQTVDMAQFFLGNETATGDLLSLGDASFVESDGAAITMTIVETDRISAVEQSATPGGDGSSLIVDVLANAVFDLATNPSVASLNLVVTESPDIIPPFITGASLNYDVGMITFTTSERIDVTPSNGIDMSKFFIAKIFL